MVLLKPLCKYTARINRVKDIVPTIRKAIQVAQSDTPGPVFVEFPVDVLYPYQMVIKELPNFKNPSLYKVIYFFIIFLKKNFKRIVETYLFAYVSRQFGGAFLPQELTPLPLNIPKPKEDDIKKTVEIIKNAKKPLIILGIFYILYVSKRDSGLTSS